METMLREIEYRDSTGIARNWLLVKHQAVNNVFDGVNISVSNGKTEMIYDVTYPGSALFFNDEQFERMVAAGYFIGRPGRYLGEGGVSITRKAIDELLLEKKQMEEAKAMLIERGYKLYMDSKAIEKNMRDDYSMCDVLRKVNNLYLIPQKEIGNIKPGTLLVSSIDAKELLYDGVMDLQLKDGFSTFGIRPMPKYVDSKLLIDSKRCTVQ